MEPHFPLPRCSVDRLLCWHARLLTLIVWCCYVFVCASRKSEAVLSKWETRSRRRRVVKFCAHCCCLLFDRVIQSSPKLVTAACSLSFGLLFCCESYSTIVVVVCDWITNASPEIYSVFVVVGETENQWLWNLFTFKVTRVDRAVNWPLPG